MFQIKINKKRYHGVHLHFVDTKILNATLIAEEKTNNYLMHPG